MIFLAGGGDAKQSYELDKQFFSEQKVLYIPFAMNTQRYDSCKEWFSSVIKQFNTPFDILTKHQDISDYEAIYIGGGNTFELVRKLKEHNIWNQLTEHIKNDKPIYGGSAGAIILGKTILTARHYDKELNILDSYEGLDVLDGYSVWPHYQESQDEKIHAFCTQHKAKVFAIPEDAGVITKDNTLISFGDAFVFENNTKKKL